MLPISKLRETQGPLGLFHYISANDKHHDLFVFHPICICDGYLKMNSIEFRILKISFTVLEISLFKVLHFGTSGAVVQSVKFT